MNYIYLFLRIKYNRASNIDESQRFHRMRDVDVFCTLYLRNPPNFQKPNVSNGFLRFVFGLKTLFEIYKLNQYIVQKEQFTAVV